MHRSKLLPFVPLLLAASGATAQCLPFHFNTAGDTITSSPGSLTWFPGPGGSCFSQLLWVHLIDVGSTPTLVSTGLPASSLSCSFPGTFGNCALPLIFGYGGPQVTLPVPAGVPSGTMVHCQSAAFVGDGTFVFGAPLIADIL